MHLNTHPIRMLKDAALRLRYGVTAKRVCTFCGYDSTLVGVIDNPLPRMPGRVLLQFQCSVCGFFEEDVG
jgi:hypothetical protein